MAMMFLIHYLLNLETIIMVHVFFRTFCTILVRELNVLVNPPTKFIGYNTPYLSFFIPLIPWNLLHPANFHFRIYNCLQIHIPCSDGSVQHSGGTWLERKTWIYYWSGFSILHVTFQVLMTFLYFKYHKSFLYLDLNLKLPKLINIGCMQQQGSHPTHGNKYYSFEYRCGLDNGRNASSSDRE